MTDFIPIDQCVVRGVYKINSRNLMVGVYDGNGGFVGIRMKFRERYLFTEYHYDTGAPYGTVRPMELIEMLPEGIEIHEYNPGPSKCSQHDRECHWSGPPAPAPWVHTDDGSELPDGDHSKGRGMYRPLFDYLDPIDQRLKEEAQA